jgi:hypothetical protein
MIKFLLLRLLLLYLQSYYLCCFPWMPYKLSNSFFYGPGYSTYGPTNSAASPKCIYKWYQIPSLTTTATLLTVPLTLLLPLNALQMTQFLLLLPLLLYLRPYQLCCFPWMPYNLYNFFSYGHCHTTYGPTNSAISPECLTNDQTPSLPTTATLLTVLLTLLLPLNAL